MRRRCKGGDRQQVPAAAVCTRASAAMVLAENMVRCSMCECERGALEDFPVRNFTLEFWIFGAEIRLLVLNGP